MATAAGSALSQRHRSAQLALRAALLRDLRLVWPLFVPTEFGSWDRFVAAAMPLVRARHRDSAGVAIRYLAEFRRIEGITTPFRPVLAEPPSEVVTRDALRATGLMGVLNARRAGRSVTESAANGFVRASGSATRLALAGGRDTITETLRADPRAVRYARVTGDRPCDFCAMLAGRGPVYGADTADFAAHDHCSCMAEPVFEAAA